MSWTEEKDLILLRQMTGFGIFEHRTGSRERGNVWQNIAMRLNGNELFGAALTTRGARDRFTLLSRRHKAKTASELKETGTGGKEQSEFDLLLEELVELNEESDKRFQEETENGKEKANIEREQAVDIRKQAMETMGQTRKRREDKGDDVKEKKKRRSGSDTMVWLEKKGEMDAVWRKNQLEEQRMERESLRTERREEMELQRMQLEMQMKAQQDQQNQQSMLIQQMLGMMQQQQQQFQAMFSKFKN